MIRIATKFLAVVALSAVLLIGCSSRPNADTKPPELPQLGVIDMEKAINAHPKHQDWQKLTQQAATLNNQLVAEAERSAKSAMSLPSVGLPDSTASGLKLALEQEFNAKMAAKQQELQTRLSSKAATVHSDLSAQLKTYAEQLDKEYQPQIFNLQLKLATVHLDEKEGAEVKKVLDTLKAAQADKLAARERELAQTVDARMAPEKAAIEQELAAYSNELNKDLSAKMAAQSAEMASRLPATSPVPKAASDSVSGLEQQLGMKQQEISALEESIINDIRDKTGKIAVERNLEAVITGHKVNVSAVDITADVIAGFKK